MYVPNWKISLNKKHKWLKMQNNRTNYNYISTTKQISSYRVWTRAAKLNLATNNSQFRALDHFAKLLLRERWK